jgi:NAD(P)-dependent dehydrogenase (short-subunit alcohol dehydrogenase family)
MALPGQSAVPSDGKRAALVNGGPGGIGQAICRRLAQSRRRRS